jgi:hypothetical protein
LSFLTLFFMSVLSKMRCWISFNASTIRKVFNSIVKFSILNLKLKMTKNSNRVAILDELKVKRKVTQSNSVQTVLCWSELSNQFRMLFALSNPSKITCVKTIQCQHQSMSDVLLRKISFTVEKIDQFWNELSTFMISSLGNFDFEHNSVGKTKVGRMISRMYWDESPEMEFRWMIPIRYRILCDWSDRVGDESHVLWIDIFTVNWLIDVRLPNCDQLGNANVVRHTAASIKQRQLKRAALGKSQRMVGSHLDLQLMIENRNM